MTMMWEVFTQQLGARFSNQFGPAGGKAFMSWAKTLRTVDVNFLKQGFALFLRSGEKFFDLHTYRQFIVKAQIAAAGIPDIDDAFSLVMRGSFDELHPAFHRIVAVRKHDLKAASVEKQERLFKKLYSEVCDRVLSGEVFERPKPLPFPEIKQPPFGKDYGRHTIREMIKELKG